MSKPEQKPFLLPLRNKVIAAFLLACIAIGLAMGTTYLSFNTLLGKMDELSLPNVKLKMLNRLFEKITQLDQQQRADAIRNPGKPLRSFLHESAQLSLTIDSLLAADWDSPMQPERLTQMKVILRQRDYYLIEFLKLKSGLLRNSNYSRRIDSLASILMEFSPSSDSTVTTLSRKTTTTRVLGDSTEKKGFFSRLFARKKSSRANENRVELTEELDMRTDTLAVARQDSAVQEVGLIMKSLEEDHRLTSQLIQRRELELVSVNITLISEMLQILNELEREEIEHIQLKNSEANELVSDHTKRVTTIIIVFFLLAALLVFLILVDISRSNYYRLQLIQAREEAERLGKIKERFLANMSHEIRTPLQSIIGYAALLGEGKHEGEAVEVIRRSSSHLLQIVNEVLDYSHLESDQFNLDVKPLFVADIVREVAAAIEIQAKQKGLSFSTRDPVYPEYRLLGDPFRIRQILYNLLNNAVKFTDQGSVTLETQIEFDLFVTCRFIISDTGIGISQQDIARVFRQFEQADTPARMKHGGAGLGLSIVKKLVDLHQGHIHAVSEPGEGSVFTVEIKLERAKESPIAVDQDNAVMQDTGDDRTVWFVDDDATILRLCGILMEKNGIPFQTLNRSEAVLGEDLSNARCALIDIRMPGMDGRELMEQLRSTYPALRLIALTAQAGHPESSSLIESGFDAVLAKPFTEEELLKVINAGRSPTPDEVVTVTEFDAVRRMTLGDDALFRSIMKQFVEESTANLHELGDCIRQGNAGMIREIVHRLAGRTGQVGSLALSGIFLDLERRLDNGDTIAALSPRLANGMSLLERLIAKAARHMNGISH